MKIFIAGTSSHKYVLEEYKNDYILESFYAIKEWQVPYIKECKMFLLDSGAFTFMNSNKGKVDFNQYLRDYINFINKYDIKYFFELDIDSIVGHEKVKEMRAVLEKGTGKKCIPVWHKSRGLEEWHKLTKEYDYVGIGGIVTKEIKPKEYKYLSALLDIAKENGCKVHGLGFTKLKLLKRYRFYSVDSTSWVSGAKFGTIYMFQDGTLKSIRCKDRRLRNGVESNHHNIEEWLKFQKYADKYL